MSKSEEVAFKKLADLMEKSIDPTIDPRKDLIGFACGKFSEENFDVANGEYHLKCGLNIFDNLLINESLNYPSLVKARNFSKSSKVSDNKSLLKDDRLRIFCGGFPALHENWSADNFDWIKTAAVLSVMGMDTIVKYGCDGIEGIKCDIHNSIYYIERITKVLQDMGIAKEKISEALDAVFAIKVKWDSCDISTLEESYKKGLRKKFLSRFLDITNGQSHTKCDFTISATKDIDRMLATLSKVDQKDVAHYLMCTAIMQYTDSSYLFKRLSLKYFTPAFIAAAYTEYWDADKKRNLAEIWRRIGETLKRKETKLIPFYNKRLQYLRDAEDYIANNFRQAKIDKQYEGLEICPHDFLRNILNMIFFNISGQGPLYSMNKYFYNFGQTLYFTHILLNGINESTLFWFINLTIDTFTSLHYSLFQFEKYDFKIFEYAISLKKDIFPFDDISQHKKEVWNCFYMTKALQISFESYKTWLADNEDLATKQNIALQRLSLNNEQAFFVAFIQRFYRCTLFSDCFGDNSFVKAIILSLSISEAFPFAQIF